MAVLLRLILVLGLLGTSKAASPRVLQALDVNAQDTTARSRVVVVEDSRAVFAFNPEPEQVEEMVNRGILALTGKDTVRDAWLSLVTTQDTVGLKVFSSPGATSGTRPVVVAAIVKGLRAAGLSTNQIVIWDKSLSDLRAAGYVQLGCQLGVQVAASQEEGYDPKAFYESSLLGKLVWGDYEFGQKGDNLGRKSYVSKLLTRRLTKIINVTPLLNHNLAQVSGSLYSLALGSVDNTIRFEAAPDPVRALGQAVPEIYALAEVGDKVVLNIVDALICQYQGEEKMLLHYSTALGQVRLSKDPVALDMLSIRELEHQRQLAKAPPLRVTSPIYSNATLLELGVNDLRQIDLNKVEISGKD